MPIRRTNHFFCCKNAFKDALLAKVAANPDVWPPRYFSDLLSSKYRAGLALNAAIWWASNGPLTDAQSAAVNDHPDVIALKAAGALYVYSADEKTAKEAIAEIGLVTESEWEDNQ